LLLRQEGAFAGRVDPARLYRIDANAICCKFGGEAPGYVADSGLAALYAACYLETEQQRARM
jgi:hypothetical protein